MLGATALGRPAIVPCTTLAASILILHCKRPSPRQAGPFGCRDKPTCNMKASDWIHLIGQIEPREREAPMIVRCGKAYVRVEIAVRGYLENRRVGDVLVESVAPVVGRPDTRLSQRPDFVGIQDSSGVLKMGCHRQVL